MAKPASASYRDIIKEVDNGVFQPVYLLMGEESYYIDIVSDYIISKALTQDEADFNLFTIYATDKTEGAEIVSAARRLPMMAKYQVVIVKEFQNMKKQFDEILPYFVKPSPTTILILSHKNGNMESGKKLVAIIRDKGRVMESPRLKEGFLPSFITDYLKNKNVAIDPQAKMMLVENIGSDLSRMASELDKLCITMPQGQNSITPELIEQNIGISKNFNQWELKTAIIKHDVMKANRIVNYFCDNPKLNPPIMTIAMLFNFFANLMQLYYAPDKSSPAAMAAHLDLKYESQLNDYLMAQKFYSAMKTMKIIEKLREADTKLKGVEKGSLTDHDVMRELIFFILH